MTQPGTALTLSERIVEQLRLKISRGGFAPGQRLSEQALSQEFAISRNTLREVFRVLTRDGLLRHVPNSGVSVAVPSIASIIDIYRVRRMLECQALTQAYPRHPARKRMREAMDEAVRWQAESNWVEVGTTNIAFHVAIVELADSERLNDLFAQLMAELRLAFGILDDPEYLHAPFVDSNLKILDLVEAAEFERASAHLSEYLIRSERLVLAAYARRLADGGTGGK
jgi:DNA-binding GntR family transcriptional regulator